MRLCHRLSWYVHKKHHHTIKKVARVARRINQGDLSQVVPVESRDKIGEVAATINELTSNLQEVTTLTSSTCNVVLKKIRMLAEQTSNRQKLSQEEIQKIMDKINLLIVFVDSFKLLQTDIE